MPCMGSVWAVDSNCFIHLGQKAEDGFVEDLQAVLRGRQLLITPGVEQEVATVLERVGKALLAIDRPELAIELFDESMECATIAGEEDRHEALSTCMVQAELALDDSERENIPMLRRLLDGLTPAVQGQQR